ncbi:MAG: DUF488 family protein [Planctomycetota bacterium]
MAKSGTLQLKRVYDDPEPTDGFRALVDRLWPRGISKENAELGDWAKDAAPSNELRKAYHGAELDFAAFREAYLAELEAEPAKAGPLVERLNNGETVTLLYAAKNQDQNHAMVLRDHIASRL